LLADPSSGPGQDDYKPVTFVVTRWHRRNGRPYCYMEDVPNFVPAGDERGEDDALPLILHLSDLHLAAPTEDEMFGDHKISVVRRSDRQGRTQLIRSSLRELGMQLHRLQRTLDAVVVSGDVTDRGNPSGFALLTPTLEELGEALPPSGQIMVVPGNHDVAWFTEPSTHARYQSFLDGVRAKGYATPLLEGIDIGPDRQQLPDAVNPVIQVAGGKIAILGLNTANYCGVAEETPPDVTAAIIDLDKRLADDQSYQQLRESWRRRGAFDVARLGAEQRRYGAAALEAYAGDALVRVATMHHQLLPVGVEEEVKPFESLLNLATARSFLAAQNIDLLLHGHKHTADLYQDIPRAPNTDRTRPLVVCSVRTVGKGQTSDGEIAKLVSIDVTFPRVHHVGFSSVPACDD
jgi:3',5'-cyclic AMP phosphodiesterase CpdA